MGRKVATRDSRIAEIAKKQYGVVSLDQLRRLDLNSKAVRSRMDAGRLHRVHRGVYAVGHVALSFEGRCMAAVLAVGRGSARPGSALDHWGTAVSHRSAAVMWELLPVAGDSIDVVVAGTGGRARRDGIRVHRSRSLVVGDVTLRQAVPVTTPARTIEDLRSALAAGRADSVSARELRKAVRQADVLGLPLGGSHRRDRTRSDLEQEFLRICRRHRLLRPAVNVRVGPHLVDFLWQDPKLIVETDSYLYHRGEAAFQEDRERDLDLRSRGYDVIRLSERQIDDEPARVAETLVAVLSTG
jgi:very-short-patch-repair endonuclease